MLESNSGILTNQIMHQCLGSIQLRIMAGEHQYVTVTRPRGQLNHRSCATLDVVQVGGNQGAMLTGNMERKGHLPKSH